MDHHLAICSCHKAEAGEHTPSPVDLLAETREWCIKIVKAELEYERG
jgi:hypothetical protein